MIKLNLGCGLDYKEDCINVDCFAYPHVDLIADLSGIWPFDDNSVDEIIAKDIFEHLPDIIHTMNECWRVLKPGGIAHIYVPSTEGVAAFGNPDHKSWWNQVTFGFFATASKKDLESPTHFRNTCHGIEATFKIRFLRRTVYKNMPGGIGIYAQLEKEIVEEKS